MSLNNHETPILHRYWRKVGGTLIEEFYAVREVRSKHAARRMDGVIIKGGEFAIKEQSEVDIAGKDIIVVQVKTGRLGMYLAGQALFSRDLMYRHNPKSVESVALCEKYDDVIGPLLKAHGIKIEIDEP
ncbi:hypothetical protein KFU94_45535 [Chloroflexi bacterium TSY]|nr:hypothetical protein [Chloroflexi bacterium TSY]